LQLCPLDHALFALSRSKLDIVWPKYFFSLILFKNVYIIVHIFLCRKTLLDFNVTLSLPHRLAYWYYIFRHRIYHCPFTYWQSFPNFCNHWTVLRSQSKCVTVYFIRMFSLAFNFPECSPMLFVPVFFQDC